MINQQVMAWLCVLLAWQQAVYANTIVHQEPHESSSRNTREGRHAGEVKAGLDAHRDASEREVLNPLTSNPGLQNISLTEINVSQQRANASQDLSSSADSTGSTADSNDADKSDKSKSKKTWKQKLQEASTGDIPENIDEAAKHCSQTMAKYWSTWTKGSGVLTIKRIGQLLNNGDITGKQAAALGALADYFYRQDRKVSSLKTADKKDSYTLEEIQSALGDLSGKRTNEALADDYRTALIQIKDDTTKDGFSLYGKLGLPRLGENVQWNVCDCYFVSAVNAVLQHDPSAIQNMITQTGPDTFEVRFPGYKDGKTPISVHLTQGDIAMFSHTKDGGCYLAVLGRAADKVMKKEHDDHSSAGNATPLGTMVDQGSHWDETNTFNLLTGKSYVQIKTTQYTDDELSKLIKYAQDHHEIIGLGEAYTPISKHYLLITGFHDGVVDVLNPWGQTRYYTPLGDDPLPFLPDMVKPDSGHVFAMHNGHFTVPLKDLVKWGFGSMTFQRQDLEAVLGSDKDRSTDNKLVSSEKSSDTNSSEEKEDKSEALAKDDSDADKASSSASGATDSSASSSSSSNSNAGNSDTTDASKVSTKSEDADADKKNAKQVKAPLTIEAAKREYDRTVQKYWDKWTANSDGKLNIKEIGALLQNPAITGKEAAVLGTLAITLTHDLINKEHKPLAAFTEAQVLSNTKETKAIKYFKDAMEQLEGDTSSSGLSLYGSTGRPDWEKVKQWKLGDCWFVSVVDAVLRKNGPEYIEKMIKQDPNDPNKFTVKFPGHKDKIDVTLTEGEIAMFSHTIKDGSWLAVLGMALNTVMEERRQQEKKPDGYRSWYPFGHVVNGGNNLLTYKLFTDKTYTRIPTSNLDEIKAALKWAENNNCPIGINTHKHDLSIKAIDWKTGKVEIQNPWGTEQTYTTDIKIKMGPDGTFWLPIADLYKDNFIKIEVPAAARVAALPASEQSKDKNKSGQDREKADLNSSQLSSITNITVPGNNPQQSPSITAGSSGGNKSTANNNAGYGGASPAAPQVSNSDASQEEQSNTDSARNDSDISESIDGLNPVKTGDLASIIKNKISIERGRFNEQLYELSQNPAGSSPATTKAMISALENSIKISRDIEDQLIDSLSSTQNTGNTNQTTLTNSVQESRINTDNELAKLDKNCIAELKSSITDERRLVDHEIEKLKEMRNEQTQANKPIQLNQGSALIANQNALRLQSPNATINLPTGAVAFVVSLNGSTVIYNLLNKKAITVDPGTGDSLLVNAGHALLLSSNTQATAEKANPMKKVPLINTKALGLYNNTSCFDAEFPYTAVMDNAPQIASLFQSNTAQNKQLVNVLLKRAAAGKLAGE